MRRLLLAFAVLGAMAAYAHAGSQTFTVNLQNGTGDSPIPGLITYQSPIQDANGDGWNETVLKITLNGSPYNQAMFQIAYSGPPTGMSVNIGDSVTNNGFGGDAATQSNDAEINIGTAPGAATGANDLLVFGKDGTPVPGNLLTQVPNFVGNGISTVKLGVANDFFSWDNNHGSAGSLTSPYLYALAGQPDTEGPVNYDIYAAFNRSVDGVYRPGTGVAQVIITLSAIPEPSSIVLGGTAALIMLAGPPHQNRWTGTNG